MLETPTPSETLVQTVRDAAIPLAGATDDDDALLDLIGEARFVLLCEASHGTHEFYRERAAITRRLVVEKGFNAIAIEGDWPDAWRVNRYVQGRGGDAFAQDALGNFERFPTWMWRNTEVVEFVDWLRAHNDSVPSFARTGFYGLDLYSLHRSMRAVLDYLAEADPDAAAIARARYACFDHFGDDANRYGLMTQVGAAPSCEEEVIRQLVDLQRHAADDGEDAFYAEQNARLVRNAEAYYRSMFLREQSSWNVRDRHMAETLDELIAFIEKQGAQPKVVVWAHNSHVGDARASQMGERGEINLGQLVRERYRDASFIVGFTTHAGTVTAADDWDEPAQRKRVRTALPGSYEALFHAVGLDRFLLPLRESDAATQALQSPRLTRAIGVIYRPETERHSHYFHARLPGQYDAVLHFDETRALEPLERTPHWRRGEVGEVPETYPTGI